MCFIVIFKKKTQNVHEKDYSPQVAHSKSTTKNWKSKISLYLSLSLSLSLSLCSNSQTSTPLQPQERKKERNSQTFPTKQNKPTSSFHFSFLPLKSVLSELISLI